MSAPPPPQSDHFMDCGVELIFVVLVASYIPSAFSLLSACIVTLNVEF